MYCDWPVLGRCCFCVPLRKGVIIFGYVNLLYTAFIMGLYSYMIHHDINSNYVSFGKVYNLPLELSIFICCVELVFGAILVYGAHMKSVPLIRACYYFAVVSTLGVILLQIIDITRVEKAHFGFVLELITLSFSGLCMQIYLITMIRSLLKRLEMSGPHEVDNQLHRIVSGEVKIDTNGVYNNTTAPTDV